MDDIVLNEDDTNQGMSVFSDWFLFDPSDRSQKEIKHSPDLFRNCKFLSTHIQFCQYFRKVGSFLSWGSWYNNLINVIRSAWMWKLCHQRLKNF